MRLTGVVVVAFAGTFGGWFRPGDPWPAAASLCRSSLSRGRVWVWATHAVVLACAYRQNCAFDELPTHSWQVTSFLYEIFMHTLSFMDRNIILAFFSLLSYFFFLWFAGSRQMNLKIHLFAGQQYHSIVDWRMKNAVPKQNELLLLTVDAIEETSKCNSAI